MRDMDRMNASLDYIQRTYDASAEYATHPMLGDADDELYCTVVAKHHSYRVCIRAQSVCYVRRESDDTVLLDAR